MALAAAFLATSGAAQATVLAQPGYTDAQVAVLQSGHGNFYGNVTVDDSGNRYVTGSFSPAVYKITPSGTVSTFATPGGGTLLGLDIIGSNLYIGAGNTIVSVPLTGGASTVVTSTTDEAMGITHSLDGHTLYVATYSGLFKIDVATHASTTLLTGLFSAVSTGLDGTIYAADYMNNMIMAYHPGTNTTSVFRNNLTHVAGLAIDPSSGDVFAGLEDTRVIDRISADGSTLTTFATDVSVDYGYYPTAMDFAPAGGSLYYTQPGSSTDFTLRQISGFAAVTANAVPEPATLSLFGLGLAAAGMRRRKKA